MMDYCTTADHKPMTKKAFIRKVVIKINGLKLGEVDIKGDRIRALPVVPQKAVANLVPKTPPKTVPEALTLPQKKAVAKVVRKTPTKTVPEALTLPKKKAVAKVIRKTPTKTVPKTSTVTHKPEAVQTGKLRELIQEALSKAMTEVTMSYDGKAEVSDPAQIAASIESLVKNKKMGQSKNNAKYRSILFNLRDPNNPDLRRRVLLGEIKPEELIDMTAEEMASNKRKRENDEIRLKSLMKYGSTRGADDEEGTTDQFRCGRCGERKCTYSQLQTRSADEPMTTYVRCVVCSNRWKF